MKEEHRSVRERLDPAWYEAKRRQLMSGVLVFSSLAMLWGFLNTLTVADGKPWDYLPFLVIAVLSLLLLCWHLVKPTHLDLISVCTVWLVSLTLILRVAVVLFLGAGQADPPDVFNGVWAFTPLQPIACHVLLRGNRAFLSAWLFIAALALLLTLYCLQSGRLPDADADLRYVVGVIALALPISIVFLRYVHFSGMLQEHTLSELALSRDLLLARQELSGARERLQLAMQTSGCGAWEWDADANTVWFDNAQQRLYGMQPGEFDGQRDTLMQRVHPEDREALKAALASSIRSGEFHEHEYRVQHPDGTQLDLSDRGRVLRDASGRVTRMTGITVDVSRDKEQLRTMNARRELLALLTDSLPYAIAHVELPQQRVRFSNRLFTEWFGKSPDGSKLPSDLRKALAAGIKTAASGKHVSLEFEAFKVAEGKIWFEAQLIPTGKSADSAGKVDAGGVNGIYLTITDIQEQRQLETSLKRDALQDALTGIFNRRYLDESLEREWRRSCREHQPISLLMLDIDLFKAYNDHFGHALGDEALRKVARQISAQALRPADVAARFGGEEFAVVLPNTTARGAKLTAERILRSVINLDIEHPAAPTKVLTISIGVATAENPKELDQEEWMRAADQALYQSKADGRNRITVVTLKA